MRRLPWPPKGGVRLLAAGLLIVAGPGSLGARDWAEEDCARFGVSDAPESVSCGYVSVPLRHGQVEGDSISLAVMVIEAGGPDRQPDPLFIAQGGPGGSTLDTFAGVLVSDPAYRPVSNRDLVLWDQRGTLYSRPFLGCPEVSRAELRSMLATESAEDPAGAEDSLAPYLACQRRLSTLTSDLSAFNSVENANDVEALRIALGYETVNFYGVSYGTELGQYLIRQHPGKVRSVVLDAVVPTDFSLITDVPYVQQRIGEKYFGSCAADAWCDEAFPELGSRFLELLDRLDETPVVLEVRDPSDPEGISYPVRLDGALLAGILYQALYMTELQPLIPYLIDRADQGDFDFLQHALLPMTLFDDTGSTGMYITVVCAGHGDVSADGLDYGGLAERLRREGRESAGALLEICESWEIEALPEEIHEPVRSSVPALLLSGDYDPITPPAFAAAVGAGLENDFEITFPSGSHGQAFSSECANGIIQSFLDAPDQWPGGACANASPDDYITPDDIIVIPAVRDAVTRADSGGLSVMLRGFSPVLIGLAILVTAVPVYAIGGIVGLFRRRSTPGAGALPGASAWLSRRAGLIALLCLAAIAGFLVCLAYALVQSAAWEPVALYLGAIHASYGWVAWLGLAAVVMTMLLISAVVGAWLSGQRTPGGRVYLSVLALAAGGALAGLYRLGLMPSAWGG